MGTKKFSAALVLAVLLAAPAMAVDFVLDRGSRADSVFFESTARLEFIKGRTADIDGWVSFDPQNPQQQAGGLLRVDLRTLKTGIDTRDGHMRDRHLHTERFPFAFFELISISGMPTKVVSDSIFHVPIKGFFYIHGVKKLVTAQMKFSIVETEGVAATISISTEFSIKLDDFQIDRPRALFMKLAEEISIVVEFTGKVGKRSSTILLPEWTELD